MNVLWNSFGSRRKLVDTTISLLSALPALYMHSLSIYPSFRVQVNLKILGSNPGMATDALQSASLVSNSLSLCIVTQCDSGVAHKELGILIFNPVFHSQFKKYLILRYQVILICYSCYWNQLVYRPPKISWVSTWPGPGARKPGRSNGAGRRPIPRSARRHLNRTL